MILMRKRTSEKEWGIKCCSNCKNAEIENYGSDYYCIFKCPKQRKESTEIKGFLDKHYCDNIQIITGFDTTTQE